MDSDADFPNPLIQFEILDLDAGFVPVKDFGSVEMRMDRSIGSAEIRMDRSISQFLVSPTQIFELEK